MYFKHEINFPSLGYIYDDVNVHLQDEIRNSTPNLLSNQAISDYSPSSIIGSGSKEHPRAPPVINRREIHYKLNYS